LYIRENLVVHLKRY